ncbi:MAG TPA: HAD family hydrolase [Gaiellales bacterium]|nr:HAD family hydrolase [Gaiellales bacterium]
MKRYRAVLFDAFGTLIELDRPAARLQAAVRMRLERGISHRQAADAMRAELTHYAANCYRARDQATLLHLQRECAAIVLGHLGLDAEEAAALAVLSDAIAFRAYPDAPPALRTVGELGLATAVVSNGDCSLPGALHSSGIDVDVVVDSATGGAAKPDPAIFELALQRLGVDAAAALHVGDVPELDGEGARAAGIDVVIVDRSPAPAAGTISSLLELEPLLA